MSTCAAQDVDKLGMFRFLFIRFKPDRYYFGVIVLGRNLLICLVPILTSKSPAMQALIMCLVLQLFMLLQVCFEGSRESALIGRILGGQV